MDNVHSEPALKQWLCLQRGIHYLNPRGYTNIATSSMPWLDEEHTLLDDQIRAMVSQCSLHCSRISTGATIKGRQYNCLNDKV